jgi:hypothetical protein
VNRRTRPESDESEQEQQDFRVRSFPTAAQMRGRLVAWLREQVPLFEAFFVAISFHVLLFPIIWFAGWALPWPKSPRITTVIEINLENWPNEATPEKIEEIYEMKMHKEH